MTNTLACINYTSNTVISYGIYANKSHRINAFMTSVSGVTWKGEDSLQFAPSLSAVYAVTPFLAASAWVTCKSSWYTGGALQIAHIRADRHTGGANYTFADGHSKFMRFETTVNPNNFFWGKQVYTAGNLLVLDQNGF